MIRILMGVLPADSGVCRLGGVDPAVDPLKVRRHVGYLAEDQTMYGWMTPVELCRFLAPFYPTWDPKLAVDSLDRFEIARHTRIGGLSKGQAVRLGLIVALAHRPRLVILDDPAMGLDPIARKEFNRDLVEHLQSSGCTVLYSSHLLDRGKIVRSGPTDRLRDDVKQIVLPADFLAAAPRPEELLDVRRHDDRVAIITDQAGSYIQQLSAVGIDHNVVDLSLDEIFEAYVIGRAHDWPDHSQSALASA
jgi:ABC-2 type transport system ATP-binding protein